MGKCAGVPLIGNLYPVFRCKLLPRVRLNNITPGWRRRGWSARLLMLKRVIVRVKGSLLLGLVIFMTPDFKVASWALGGIDVYIPELLWGSVVVVTEYL